MLNISKNSINHKIDFNSYSVSYLLQRGWGKKLIWTLLITASIILIFITFLPWRQNIQAKGEVTTRSPEQRPQAIQSVISGRLEKWYVREGDFVRKGDTIVEISEVKNEYFDPNLIERTLEQVKAKEQSIVSYDDKIQALDKQYEALQATMSLKIKQTENKIKQAQNQIQIDSMELVAMKTNYDIAQNQIKRIQSLYDKGLKSLSELQEKQLKLQQTAAKVVMQENKLNNERNDLINTMLELTTIEKQYFDKLAKSRSERQSALSDKLNSMAATSKLKNQLSNYEQRQQFYFVLAPQNGYITQTLQRGIGMIVKEGTDIVTIAPADYHLATSLYIKPQDIPLINIGQNVRIIFDGWPAIVISGWPELNTGVFTGEVIAIDKFIDNNGYYRILVTENNPDKPWPQHLRVGTGVRSFLMLNRVPIWYEVWRQLNGFPPDFYTNGSSDLMNKKQVK
jgi:adhesin transport system membrane fusion protein